jgi:hypothetical protein
VIEREIPVTRVGVMNIEIRSRRLELTDHVEWPVLTEEPDLGRMIANLAVFSPGRLPVRGRKPAEVYW